MVKIVIVRLTINIYLFKKSDQMGIFDNPPGIFLVLQFLYKLRLDLAKHKINKLG